MYLSLRLENTQSVARDHLANERTFLAWLRTSLTFASVGVALTQLFRMQSFKAGSFARTASMVVGSLFIAGGLLVLAMGLVRYFNVQFVLQRGQFPATRASIIICFAMCMSLFVVALAVVIKSAID